MGRVDYFSEESLKTRLGGKAVSGVAFVGGGQAIGTLLKLATFPILCRLVAPDDFGLVAIAVGIAGVAAMLTDAGLSMATVQAERITPQHVSNLFWVSSAVGLVVGLLIAIAARPIAWVYVDARLEVVLYALAPTSLLAGVTTQPMALLRRGMQNREIAAIELVAQVASFIGGLSAGVWLRDYRALVVMQLIPFPIRLAGATLCCHWRPGAPRAAEGSLKLVGFGSTLLGANTLSFASQKADRLILGAVAPMSEVGLYDRTYEVLMATVRRFTEPFGRVLTPVLSRTAQSPTNYLRAYQTSIVGLSAFCAPVVATLLTIPEGFVTLVLGPEWSAAAPLVVILAFGVWMLPINVSTGWLFVSQGRADALLSWNLFDVATRLVTLPIGACWGATGLAVAAVIRVAGLSPELYRRIGKQGPVRARLMWRLVLIQSVAVVAGLAAAAPTARTGLSGVTQFVCVGLAAMVASVAALCCFEEFRFGVRRACALIAERLARRSGSATGTATEQCTGPGGEL